MRVIIRIGNTQWHASETGNIRYHAKETINRKTQYHASENKNRKTYDTMRMRLGIRT